MRKAKIIFTISLFFIGCNSRVTKDSNANYFKEYYENSTVLQWEGLVINNKREGLHLFYYPSGNIRKAVNYVNDEENGIRLDYYDSITWNVEIRTKKLNNITIDTTFFYRKDGSIEQKNIRSKKGNLLKKQIYDYNGRLMEDYSFVHVHYVNDPFLNTWIKYDTTGNILDSESHFYEILNKKKSYNKGGKEYLNIKYYPILDEKIKVYFGDIDEDFSFDSTKVNILKISSKTFSMPLDLSKKGKKIFRFIIEDYGYKEEFGQVASKSVFGEYEYIVE